MRLFDILGILFVTAWVVVIAAFILADEGEAIRLSLVDGDIDLREETTWMTVFRAGDEVGVLREDRTRLIDGWLIEMQGIVELNILSESYAFRFTSRSTLNEDLTRRSASGSVEAFGLNLVMTGNLHHQDDGVEFHVTVRLDSAVERFVAALDEAPRLSVHAIPQMIASEELAEGVRFEHEFFDPLTLSPTHITMVYQGRDNIVNFDGDHVEAHAFRQTMGNFSSEIRTDDRGMIIQQVLPMQIAIARLPEFLGRNLMVKMEEIFDDAKTKRPPFVDAISAEDLLALVARLGSGQVERLRPVDEFLVDDAATDEAERDRRDAVEEEPREFLVEPLPADPELLDLVGPRQHVAIQTDRRARIVTGRDNTLWYVGMAPSPSAFTADADTAADEVAQELVSKVEAKPGELDVAAIADVVRPRCAQDFDEGDHLSCQQLLARALTALEHPPHFAHGVVAGDDGLSPHIWLVIFKNSRHLGSIDLASADGGVSANHLQLFLSDAPDTARLEELAPIVSIHP